MAKRKERLRDYKLMKEEELKDKIKELEIQFMKNSSEFGKAKMSKSKGNLATYGNNLNKNFRKEIARINTIISQRKQNNLNKLKTGG